MRAERDDAVLGASPWPSPLFSYAVRLRDPNVEEVKAWFGERRRVNFTWWLGPSTTPPGLRARLLADGAEPYARVAAMALDREPPPVPGVEIRRVETFDDYLLGQRIGWDAWAVPEEDRAPELAAARERWEARGDRIDSFVAFVEGEPAGRGAVLYLPGAGALVGGAVVPHLRGRGAYRALVRARWDAAVARGTPTLVVHAQPETSQPILDRLGFGHVCTVELLRDRP